MEPDEDEDPTRLCAKCGLRPRWSKHGACRHCAPCAGVRNLTFCLRARKTDEPPRKVTPSPAAARQQERYHELRRLGMPSHQARDSVSGRAVFEAALKKLLSGA
jgi:hypothetical protein